MKIASYHSSSPCEDSQKILQTLYAEALALDRAGYLLEAERTYREVLELDPSPAEVWRYLGTVYLQLGKYEEALDAMQQSLQRDDHSPVQYYSLGLVLGKLGDFSQAIAAYEQAIALDSQCVEAYNYLGNLYLELGQNEAAEEVFVSAIAAQPKSFKTHLNLGNLLLSQQKVNEAISSYLTALQCKPRDPDILNNLGVAFLAKNDAIQAALYLGYAAYRQRNYEVAISHYQDFLDTQIGDVELFLALADCHQCLQQWESAISTYHQGLQIYPDAADLYLSLAASLQSCGEIDSAMDVLKIGLKRIPNDLCLQVEQARILPIIYQNQTEISGYRQKITAGITENLPKIALANSPDQKNVLKAIGWRTNFYLQYQGENDLTLQKEYGEFVNRVMAANYPDWVKPRELSQKADRKIRIGYVSACLHWHTVGTVFLGWLRERDRTRFQVSCYYTEFQQDQYTQLFQLYSDNFYHIPHQLEALCEQILADELDILVFLDIGMSPQMTQLAGLRLAPIQCSAWGHPVTSGSPTIDYFLSGDLMEPAAAQSHYSEKLIRLPNIGVAYPKPTIPAKKRRRSDFNLGEDKIIYLSCQSLFKYLPQHDEIFAAIAQQVPHAQFVFTSHKNSYITAQFRQRLQTAFGNFGLDSEKFCVILPRLNKSDYWNLHGVSDIFLDSIGFTGFLTTLDAIACNLPVVTCPGEVMRTRQSMGILTMLGVTETIAKTPQEYVKIAIQLGQDSTWRKTISQKIEERHPYLYNDRQCIEALESFYRQVAQGANLTEREMLH